GIPVFRPVVKQTQQVVAHLGPKPKNPLERIGGPPIDGHDAEVAIEDLDERIRRFHDIHQYLALGQGTSHALLQTLVETAKLLLRGFASGDIDGGADDAPAAVAFEYGPSFGRYPADDAVFLSDGAIFDVVERAFHGVARRGVGCNRGLPIVGMKSAVV